MGNRFSVDTGVGEVVAQAPGPERFVLGPSFEAAPPYFGHGSGSDRIRRFQTAPEEHVGMYERTQEGWVQVGDTLDGRVRMNRETGEVHMQTAVGDVVRSHFKTRDGWKQMKNEPAGHTHMERYTLPVMNRPRRGVSIDPLTLEPESDTIVARNFRMVKHSVTTCLRTGRVTREAWYEEV